MLCHRAIPGGGAVRLLAEPDPDGDTLSVTSIGTFDLPHGRLVIGADGQYSYTLDNTNVDLETLDVGQSLTDSFTYTVSDGKGHTATAILRIRIAGVTDNKAPTPEDDLNSVREDSLPNPISDNVLFNDVDPDGDTLTVTNTGQFDLGHGVLTIRADGGYTYALDNTNIDVDDLKDINRRMNEGDSAFVGVWEKIRNEWADYSGGFSRRTAAA